MICVVLTDDYFGELLRTECSPGAAIWYASGTVHIQEFHNEKSSFWSQCCECFGLDMCDWTMDEL